MFVLCLRLCLRQLTGNLRSCVQTCQGMDGLAGKDPSSYCTRQRLLLAWDQQSLTLCLGRSQQLLHPQKLWLRWLAASFLVQIFADLARDQYHGHQTTDSEVGF